MRNLVKKNSNDRNLRKNENRKNYKGRRRNSARFNRRDGCGERRTAQARIYGGLFYFSNGLAGKILQKFIKYEFHAALYGDFSVYASNPLKDFIYESIRGRDIFFTGSAQIAEQKLRRK